MFLMLLLLLGVVFVLLHWAGIGPSANWPWWALLLPFGLAVLWWTRSASRRDVPVPSSRLA
jgi:small Trp-rich protein